MDVWHGWGDDSQTLFSTDNGLYRSDFEADEAVLLYRFDRALSGFQRPGLGETHDFKVTTETPFETKLETFAVEPDGLIPFSTTTLSGDVWLADGYGG